MESYLTYVIAYIINMIDIIEKAIQVSYVQRFCRAKRQASYAFTPHL
jgi:hypothetical protein